MSYDDAKFMRYDPEARSTLAACAEPKKLPLLRKKVAHNQDCSESILVRLSGFIERMYGANSPENSVDKVPPPANILGQMEYSIDRETENLHRIEKLVNILEEIV